MHAKTKKFLTWLVLLAVLCGGLWVIHYLIAFPESGARTIAILALIAFNVLMLVSWLEERAKTKREAQRGWRICALGLLCSYQERDAGGRWSGIRFEATWTSRNHTDYLESVRLPTAENWFQTPSWAAMRRDEIIRRFKAEYPSVEFLEAGESELRATPTPLVAGNEKARSTTE